uniref:X-box-binding protein 1 n=1 Tax=Paramormyrops kingsleyae TaxID=1676925 RepID=A0A3B3QLW9_9TELE
MVVVTTGTGGAHKIYLISGKQSAGSGAADGRFSRSVSVVLPPSGNQASSDTDSQGSGPPQRKRQRLTHLSPEEKSLRRKLKNRVAAQTARDRKKAKMGELEQQVSELELENQKLHLENKLLREKTKSLMSENQEFRQRLGLDTLDVQEKFQNAPSSVDAVSTVIGSSESAALRLRVPLQKVQAQHSSKLRSSNWMCAVMALQVLSLISSWAFWTSLTQNCCSGVAPWTRTPCRSWTGSNQIQYPPPLIQMWGPHRQGWKALMN